MAANHGISASTLSAISKGMDDVIHATLSEIKLKKKNVNITPQKKLEGVPRKRFEEMRSKNVSLSGEVAEQKALCFAYAQGAATSGQALDSLLCSSQTFRARQNYFQVGAAAAVITMSW